jgi:hypothetical protein
MYINITKYNMNEGRERDSEMVHCARTYITLRMYLRGYYRVLAYSLFSYSYVRVGRRMLFITNDLYIHLSTILTLMIESI